MTLSDSRRALLRQSALMLAASALPAAAQPAGTQVPPGSLAQDVPFGRVGSRELRLDVYGMAPGQRRPAIVYIHGGAWQTGDKLPLPRPLAVMAANGFVVAAIQYRRLSEGPFPGQLHDCKGAVRFLRANAASFGIAPARIGAVGVSSGGHLALMLGATAGRTELEGDVGGNLDQPSDVRAVVNYFGPTDFLSFAEACGAGDTCLMGGARGQALLGRLLGCGDPAACVEAARAASPVTYVAAGIAPTLTIHGARDPVVPVQQARLWHEAVQRAGGESRLLELPEAGHGTGLTAQAHQATGQFLLMQLAR